VRGRRGRTPGGSRPTLAIAAGLTLLAGCVSGGGAGGGGAGSSPSASSTASAASGRPSAGPTPTAGPTPSGSQLIAVSVTGGEVTPKPARVKVPTGRTVLLRVTSDVADEVHVHGYDLKRDVTAGGTATLDFVA